ncbi:MAG: 2Fe-2S iron-sulfur cluster-binding protein [Streptosporangiales bacterium]
MRPRTREHTAASELVPVEMTVNGTEVSLDVPARMTLADVLRERLGLTGTHLGCEHGVCGMCTVLVDGEATRSCLLFACQVDRAELVTVEGLGSPDDLHPLQASFGRHHGLQCGFCTPGFLMSSYDLLSHDSAVERADLPAELSGVLCRCTGYRNIVDAVDDVATACREGIPAPKNCGERVLLGRRSAPLSSAAGGAAQAPDVDAEPAPTVPDEIKLPASEPSVSIEVTSTLEASPSAVAAVFGDVPLLARCLPGAELTRDLGNDWYAGRARVTLGPIGLSFGGIAHLLSHEADRIHILAQGDDAAGSRAQAEIHLQAFSAGTGTTLRANAHLFLAGRIAGFGRSLAGDVSRRMFEQFASAVDRTARGERPAADARPPSAVRMLIDALRGRYERARARGRQAREQIRRRRGKR